MAYWLNEDSRDFLSHDYLVEGQTPEQRIDIIGRTVQGYFPEEKNLGDDISQDILDGSYSLSSPMWSNFGTDRGLPISCNGVYMGDSVSSIAMKNAEIAMQTKLGAGTSAYFDLRERGARISVGGYSYGPMHFIPLTDAGVSIISQGSVRRGSAGGYMHVRHPQILDFLEIKEEGHELQNLNIGVVIDDAWMEDMLKGNGWNRKVWARIVKKRSETGYPYIFFVDAVNRNKPQVYKDKGMHIWASNLCTEIALPASEEESFVCCLGSMNLTRFDHWKDNGAVRRKTFLLDAALSEYVEKIDNHSDPLVRVLMASASRFARRHRAIGIGTLGYHSALQAEMIPFESMDARLRNRKWHRAIDEQSLEASKEMAAKYGEPDLLQGYGLRHTTRMAIAPTTSSSFILGQVSPGIEPLGSNYFTKALAKGKYPYKNPYLKEVLADHGHDDIATWESILVNGGSVQHLDFLSERVKNIFKTFGEITQMEIIQQAADRAPFIDQAQSMNLTIHPSTPAIDISELMIQAWKMDTKTMYYQRSTSPTQEYARNLSSCVACEA